MLLLFLNILISNEPQIDWSYLRWGLHCSTIDRCFHPGIGMTNDCRFDCFISTLPQSKMSTLLGCNKQWLVPRKIVNFVARGTSFQVICYVRGKFEAGNSLNPAVNGGRRSTLAGSSALLPSDVIDFANVTRWESGKQFHCWMSYDLEVTNESAHCWEKISSYITKTNVFNVGCYWGAHLEATFDVWKLPNISCGWYQLFCGSFGRTQGHCKLSGFHTCGATYW